MSVEERIQAFVKLGKIIKKALDDDSIEPVLNRAQAENGWFTPDYSRQALGAIADEFLNEKKLRQWLSGYQVPDTQSEKTVGLVLAGNIPLVGWHDIMCILLAGHKAAIKLSSKDSALTKWLLGKLGEVSPAMAARFTIVEQLKGMDAVIATGSNNTARYFEYYFSRYPHIIRHNRNSVAVLTGKETAEDLKALAHDIFDYYGLGCRNVSKLYVPENYDFFTLIEALAPYGEKAFQNNKYRNNYDYHKSLLLLNRDQHLDSGFLLIKPEKALASPVASVHYETYTSIADLEQELQENGKRVQCIVARPGAIKNAIPFGNTQCPGPGDYADNVDTLQFLLSL
jgi:hypothetical protein